MRPLAPFSPLAVCEIVVGCLKWLKKFSAAWGRERDRKVDPVPTYKAGSDAQGSGVLPSKVACVSTLSIVIVLSRQGVSIVKYWIDTEFIARPYTIDLISIGLVAEDGGEFYAESSEVDWSRASPWTLENVRSQLEGKRMKREEIGYH